MKSKKHHLIGLFLFVALFCSAQNGKFNFGARNSAMAGSSVTFGDALSLFNNIGGLGKVEGNYALAGYRNQFGLSEFQTVAAGIIYNSSFGNAGVGFYRFGDDLFSQQRIHLAFGHQLQLVSLGFGLDLLQYNVSTLGAKRALSVQFGGIAEINPQFLIGAHVSNLNQATMVESTGERVPTVMKAGVSYRPTEELMLNAEVEKDLDFAEVLKFGLEYRIISRVHLRTGISTQPLTNAFGIGFQPKKFLLDYAYSSTRSIGGIHELTLTFSFER